MKKNMFLTYFVIVIIIILSCFLTFGVTKSYFENKNKIAIDDLFGTYLMNDGEEYYISISVSPKGDDPENKGFYSLLDKSARIIERGEADLSEKGIITIHKDDGSVEEICFFKDAVYFCRVNKEPIEIEKVSDESL